MCPPDEPARKLIAPPLRVAVLLMKLECSTYPSVTPTSNEIAPPSTPAVLFMKLAWSK